MPPTIPRFVAHDVPDLINSLPSLFGFWPAESLIAIATYGPRRRFGFCLRLDLPDGMWADEVSSTVMRHLLKNRAEGAILIALTERQDDAIEILDAIHNALDDSGEVDLVVRARADGVRYWTDALGDPEQGTEYECSPHHVSIVSAVAGGQEILPDRQALVDQFRGPVGERRRWLEHGAAAVVAEVNAQVSRLATDEVGHAGLAVVEPILQRAAAGETLSDGDYLRFAVWVAHVPVRDALWSRITRDTAHELLPVLTALSRHTIAPFEPGVLSLAAFAAWLVGDGTRALIAVERALQADRCCTVALLLLGLLDNGVSPATWAGEGAGETASQEAS